MMNVYLQFNDHVRNNCWRGCEHFQLLSRGDRENDRGGDRESGRDRDRDHGERTKTPQAAGSTWTCRYCPVAVM
eukprot:1332618-Amorphochlora_amoeboformis.AAC.1